MRLLVTANLAGDLRFLPRCYSAIKTLKPTVLVDTGRACAEDQWVCAATENRAPYVVMDAMGYHLAFADDLSSESHAKLQATIQTQVVPADRIATLSDGLRVQVTDDETPTFSESGILHLPRPPKTHLLVIDLNAVTIIQTSVTIVTAAPEATIAATVEFVESEARYYQNKRGTAT